MDWSIWSNIDFTITQIYPYQMAAEPGGVLRGEVRIRNPVPREA